MRPDFDWSMSTAGLTAQEICLPTESPFLRASYCHSMARSKPSWSNPHEREKLYFSMESQHIDPGSFPSYQPLPPTLSVEKKKHSPCTQRLPQKKSRPTLPSLSLSPEPSTPSPDDDQVVPSFQRLSMHDASRGATSPPQTPGGGGGGGGGGGRCSKPLPPLPARPDPEQDMDREVEELFLGTEDSRCLVPDLCSKPSPFRYGAPFRRSFRDCGKINPAYFEGPAVQPRPPPQPHSQQHHHLQRRESNRESVEKRPPEPPESPGPRQQDRALRKLRRSQSGPAGSKPSLLRSSCRSRRPPATDRATVPPPVPPRPSKTAVDYRRWSAGDPHGGYSDEDRPPKLPPREPVPVGCSRTPSPKSLPTYFNGVMPPTQSFAPDPKYVSLQRQNSEGSPCILPVIENGRQASSTHYFLLPLGRGGREDST